MGDTRGSTEQVVRLPPPCTQSISLVNKHSVLLSTPKMPEKLLGKLPIIVASAAERATSVHPIYSIARMSWSPPSALARRPCRAIPKGIWKLSTAKRTPVHNIHMLGKVLPPTQISLRPFDAVHNVSEPGSDNITVCFREHPSQFPTFWELLP